jgi:DNA-binding LacI/PurR family transcriptional regulator
MTTRDAPPAMADVARVAGVSHQTVSRVLNGNGPVSLSTRNKVLDAIERTGYRRNLAARTLVTRRSSIIGVLVVNATLSGPSGALLGVERAARVRGYWVTVVGLAEVEEAQIGPAISHFKDQGVDGIIAVAPTQASLDCVVRTVGDLPLVAVTTGQAPAGILTADIDQVGGVTQLMTLLLGLGHKDIVHVGGPEGHLHAMWRERAWRRAMKAAGLPVGQVIRGDWSAASGYRAAMRILAGGRRPTAVVVANDQMALGLLRGIFEAGLKVPDDISVVGFDDNPGADQAIPPLTTIRQDFDLLGSRCVDLLLDVMGGQPGSPVLVQPDLIMRASVAAPRPATTQGDTQWA